MIRHYQRKMAKIAKAITSKNGVKIGFCLLLLLVSSLAISQKNFSNPLENLSESDSSPSIPVESLPIKTLSPDVNVKQIAQKTTIRIMTSNTSGSGVIVERQGQTYTVLTNWHVVGFSEDYTILTPDGQEYIPNQPPQQLGEIDLAILQFNSVVEYEVASMSFVPLEIGQKTFASGFPMYHKEKTEKTFDLGIEVFNFTTGEVSLLPEKSLSQGYRLGYTNEIKVGMSGGPIFNNLGLLIGINGRTKYRNPDFGTYLFEDGSEPAPELLEDMISSSWGIPINSYLQFISLSRSQE